LFYSVLRQVSLYIYYKTLQWHFLVQELEETNTKIESKEMEATEKSEDPGGSSGDNNNSFKESGREKNSAYCLT